jgi:hypothetical protein
VVFERIRLRRSEAGIEVVEKTDSDGNKLSCFADSKLDLNVPPGESAEDPEEVISTNDRQRELGDSSKAYLMFKSNSAVALIGSHLCGGASQ